MTDQEQTFISHLVELRDRVLRAVLAVLIVFLALMPWASEIYDLLAQPMMQAVMNSVSVNLVRAGAYFERAGGFVKGRSARTPPRASLDADQ